MRLIGNVLILLMLNGCLPFGIGIPSAPIPLPNLLVDSSIYPPGWKREGVEKNEFHTAGDLENISISFRSSSPDDNVSNQFIWQFASSDDARRGFDVMIAHDNANDPELVESSKISYTSRIAQRMIIRCNTQSLCDVLAQYGSYVTEFSAYLDNRSMNQVDFMRILNEIDKKMAAVANQ